MNENIYEEWIEEIIPKNAYEHFINDLKETYREEFGWQINNVKITEINENEIKVTLNLIKNNIEETNIKSR